jgi:hypothetical protein
MIEETYKNDLKGISGDLPLIGGKLSDNLQKLSSNEETRAIAEKINNLVLNNDLNGLKLLYSQYANG